MKNVYFKYWFGYIVIPAVAVSLSMSLETEDSIIDNFLGALIISLPVAYVFSMFHKWYREKNPKKKVQTGEKYIQGIWRYYLIFVSVFIILKTTTVYLVELGDAQIFFWFLMIWPLLNLAVFTIFKKISDTHFETKPSQILVAFPTLPFLAYIPFAGFINIIDLFLIVLAIILLLKNEYKNTLQ